MGILIIILISVTVYFIGMFITQIFIIVHDNFATFADRFDNPEIVAMFWPMTVPLILVRALIIKLCKNTKDIGDRISMKLRNRKTR